MVLLLATLALALGLSADSALGAGEPRPACLACHPVHYAKKGSCTGCHRGNAASSRRNIAHYLLIPGRYARFTLGEPAAVREGTRQLEQLACRRCHVSGGKGNRLAASLDGLLESKPADEIAGAIRFPALGMPDFMLDEARIANLVNTIFAGAQKTLKQERERPVTVHFQKSPRQSKDVFSDKCGACHRLLSADRGLLGVGEIGPNLSGLLSEFYPADAEGGKRWTRRRLQSWLENPRKIKANALMLPVRLDARQFEELSTVLGAAADYRPSDGGR